MKKILSVLLVIMLSLSGLSAFAVEIPDFNAWLAEQVGDAQLSTTQSFLDALDKYNVSYNFLGALSDGSEYVTISNYDEANSLSYRLNASFAPDLGSATITVLDLLSFEPDAYSIAMDICKAIYADYGNLLFVPNETKNTISFAYTVDLSECENVGIQVLAIIIDVADIIANEYGRFVSIIDNGTELENTATPQPTATPEPTPTPEPTATPTPIPTAPNSSSSSGTALDPLLVERFGTPSGFAYFYNDLAIDSLLEGTMPGIDAQMKKAFHLTYSENDSAINGNPTYQTDMGFSLVFYCDDVDTRANKMEFIGDFANLDAATVSSITGMVAEIYALSVGADAEESDIAGNNCILFALGIKANYENDLFSMTYKSDAAGNTHITFERK